LSHPLLDRLVDRDRAVRSEACREVVDDPSAVLLLDALGEALADPERKVSRAASDALVVLSARHSEVRDVLRRALRGDEPRARWAAVFVMARLGPPEPGWLPAIIEGLGSDHTEVRWTAARLLVDLGRLDGQTLPLATGLARSDERPQVRRMAIFCLRELGADDVSVTATLKRAAEDPNPEVRRAAVLSLSALARRAQNSNASSE
jgi:HEAT repeat protein